MYDVKPNLIFGFHGCDVQVRDSLLKNPDIIKISKAPYDCTTQRMPIPQQEKDTNPKVSGDIQNSWN